MRGPVSEVWRRMRIPDREYLGHLIQGPGHGTITQLLPWGDIGDWAREQHRQETIDRGNYGVPGQKRATGARVESKCLHDYMRAVWVLSSACDFGWGRIVARGAGSWSEHDGVGYGRQAIIDAEVGLKMTVTVVKRPRGTKGGGRGAGRWGILRKLTTGRCSK